MGDLSEVENSFARFPHKPFFKVIENKSFINLIYIYILNSEFYLNIWTCSYISYMISCIISTTPPYFGNIYAFKECTPFT